MSEQKKEQKSAEAYIEDLQVLCARFLPKMKLPTLALSVVVAPECSFELGRLLRAFVDCDQSREALKAVLADICLCLEKPSSRLESLLRETSEWSYARNFFQELTFAVKPSILGLSYQIDNVAKQFGLTIAEEGLLPRLEKEYSYSILQKRLSRPSDYVDNDNFKDCRIRIYRIAVNLLEMAMASKDDFRKRSLTENLNLIRTIRILFGLCMAEGSVPYKFGQPYVNDENGYSMDSLLHFELQLNPIEIYERVFKPMWTEIMRYSVAQDESGCVEDVGYLNNAREAEIPGKFLQRRAYFNMRWTQQSQVAIQASLYQQAPTSDWTLTELTTQVRQGFYKSYEVTAEKVPPEGGTSNRVSIVVAPEFDPETSCVTWKDEKQQLARYKSLRQPLPLPRLGSLQEIEAIGNQLKSEFPWAQEAIEELVGDLWVRRAFGTVQASMQATLLVGPPGCGKTRLARRLSELLDMACLSIGMTDGIHKVLEGTARGWASGRCGSIVDMLASRRVGGGLVLLDEIDKVCSGDSAKSAENLAVLMQLLEPENAARFYDVFLLTNVNLSGVSFIATANSLDKMPGALMSRLRPVFVGKPGQEHLQVLAQGILNDIATQWRLPIEALPQLANLELKDSMSAREIRMLVQQWLKRWAMENRQTALH